MQQQRGGVNLVPVCGEVEGRPAAHGQTALLDAGIHVSAVAQQQLHAVAVAVHRGKHESRCLVLKASPLRPNPAPLQHLESEQAGRVIDRQEEQHPRGVGAHALHTRRVQAQFGGCQPCVGVYLAQACHIAPHCSLQHALPFLFLAASSRWAIWSLIGRTMRCSAPMQQQ